MVAHSYGGIVTAEAAAGVDAVRHLLLVSSYLPEVGQSLSSFGGEEPAPFLDIDPEGGTFTVRPEALAETFLQDCDPEIQRQAMDKTARQSLAVLEQPVQSAAWQHVPSTYLVCAQDRGTPADRQREFAGSSSQRRGTRRRPPPIPLPARRGPRPDRRAVTASALRLRGRAGRPRRGARAARGTRSRTRRAARAAPPRRPGPRSMTTSLTSIASTRGRRRRRVPRIPRRARISAPSMSIFTTSRRSRPASGGPRVEGRQRRGADDLALTELRAHARVEGAVARVGAQLERALLLPQTGPDDLDRQAVAGGGGADRRPPSPRSARRRRRGRRRAPAAAAPP